MENTMNQVETKPSILESSTLAYWELSRCYNGRTKKVITVETALKFSSSALKRLSPNRPLFRVIDALQREIIRGDGIDSAEMA